jgi:hypothetical protein
MERHAPHRGGVLDVSLAAWAQLGSPFNPCTTDTATVLPCRLACMRCLWVRSTHGLLWVCSPPLCCREHACASAMSAACHGPQTSP